jgi:hypothetical protein
LTEHQSAEPHERGACSAHFDALAEFAQSLAQADFVEGPEGELNEGPELPLKTSEHRA